MKKWLKNLTLILLSVLLAFSLVGCDDTYEDGEYYEECEQFGAADREDSLFCPVKYSL